MDLDSFMNNFLPIVVNQDTSEWDFAYFLMRNDPEPADYNGYSQHTLKVKNESD